jgi:VWFA-related protein
MISRRTLLFGAACSAWAQQQATFSTDVKVVSLLATVHDRDGRVVKDLNKEDFTVWEDGKPQTIRYFSRESDLPLTLGLLVDTSRSQIDVLERERSASYTFLSQVLREKIDQAFVVSFDKQVQVLQGMTSSRQELSAALAKLQIPGEVATLIYEAVRQSSENLMRKQKGRKALILLTDGVSFRDKSDITTAIEFAQRADTMIYAIRFFGRTPTYRPVRKVVLGIAEANSKHSLERMANETGGESLEVTNDKPIEAVYSQIDELLRNQYNIGFTPDRPDDHGKFHKIKLVGKDRTMTVRTSDGYYSQ